MPPRDMKLAGYEADLGAFGKYTVIKKLGQGASASVLLAKKSDSGVKVAIKCVDKRSMTEEKIDKLFREVRIMSKLRHPNIIKLYEVLESDSFVYIVMEYAAGGELFGYIIDNGSLKEEDARTLFLQLVSAVYYCHCKRIVHRDLKAENILLDESGNIKVTDFGLSNLFHPDVARHTYCGSPPYAAPEVFLSQQYTGPEVDIWSMGIVLYALVSGCLPFPGDTFRELKENVTRGLFYIPPSMSPDLANLLKSMIVVDPKKRASLELYRDDIWLNGSSNLMRKLFMRRATTGIAMDEDEEIINAMIRKYHYTREAILRSIQTNAYDDITALYSLMLDEKMRNSENASGPRPFEYSSRRASISSTDSSNSSSPINGHTISPVNGVTVPTNRRLSMDVHGTQPPSSPEPKHHSRSRSEEQTTQTTPRTGRRRPGLSIHVEEHDVIDEGNETDSTAGDASPPLSAMDGSPPASPGPVQSGGGSVSGRRSRRLSIKSLTHMIRHRLGGERKTAPDVANKAAETGSQVMATVPE